MWKVLVPLFSIVIMSWVVFWMSEERLARRASVSATGILTIIAFQFIIAESLPKVAYMTTMDRILLLSFITTAATMLINVIVASPRLQANGVASKIDRVCMRVFPAAFVVGLMVVMWWHGG